MRLEVGGRGCSRKGEGDAVPSASIISMAVEGADGGGEGGAGEAEEVGVEAKERPRLEAPDWR